MSMPYFMENISWYEWDEESNYYKVKENAPQKAKASYLEFMAEMSGSNDPEDKIIYR